MYTRDHPMTGFAHLGDAISRPEWIQRWETMRHGSLHWLMECLGETLGVYFYVYCGVGANAAFTIGNISKVAGIGSLQTIALGYAIGIAMAISVAAPLSGGHFNPAVTISLAIWKGFPWKKVPRFIIAQTLGAFLACFAVYLQYRTTFYRLEETLVAEGTYKTVQFTPDGVAGIFAVYTPQDANLRDVFANEFFADFYIALVIWGVLDPTNFFVPPPSAPWVIGFAYGTSIWAFGPGVFCGNTARDLGARFMAYAVWGKPSLSIRYTAISALTNIPATLLATLLYELVFVDSSKVLPRAHQEFINGQRAHLDHIILNPEMHRNPNLNHSSTDKADFIGVEHVA